MQGCFKPSRRQRCPNLPTRRDSLISNETGPHATPQEQKAKINQLLRLPRSFVCLAPLSASARIIVFISTAASIQLRAAMRMSGARPPTPT